MSDGGRGQAPSFGDLAAWAAAWNISPATARERFAQFVILASIAGTRPLQEGLVFKGGNALDFVWNANRSTIDLDFSIERTVLAHADLRRSLDAALTMAQQRFGVTVRIQRWDVFPRNPEAAAFSAVKATVGYALPDQPAIVRRMDAGLGSSQKIPLDIAFDDPVCASTIEHLAPGVSLTVATPDDIAAEKLRALLQQPIRNRSRPQDILDLALLIRTGTLDPDSVGRFLLVKAGSRGVSVSREAFAHPDIRERASRDYQFLADQTRSTFIPFDDAFATVLDFVETLPIP